MWLQSWIALLGYLLVLYVPNGRGDGSDEQTKVCMYSISSYKGLPDGRNMYSSDNLSPLNVTEHVRKEDDADQVLINNGTQQVCHVTTDGCYSFWMVEKNTTRHILMQGCWSGSHDAVRPTKCAGYPMNNHNITYFFCFCDAHLCNKVMTEDGVPDLPPPMPVSPTVIEQANSKYRMNTIIIALVSVLSVAVVILVSYLAIRLYCRTPKPDLKPLGLMDGPPTPIFDLDQLKMTSLISHGRFGEVWKGTLDDVEVAVKVFNMSQKNCYLNERSLFMLPLMDHNSLPRFYGAEERLTEDGAVQFLVVMSYVPLGTVSDYLKVNTVNWQTLCGMYHSIASGLAHLHTDITKGDKCKPSIAHRDLNTRNILVQEDLTCCIVDFGFAMKVDHRGNPGNGQEENVEQTSLTDVGTLRYMAPEVLEGAVNLRDCEASLKQIDVYSLGLIFWEMGMRCHDLYQGLPAPAYQLPFQADLGTHPTFEQMQYWVARNKKRPAFPDIWKDTNQAIRALKETIEDCWDQDAEARLTAMCVEERTLDMMALWETRHKGVTPTITSLGDLEEKVNVQRNPMSVCQTADDTLNEADRAPTQTEAPGGYTLESNERQAQQLLQQQQQQQQQRNDRRFSFTAENSVSTSTVETTVLSPSEQDGPLVNLNFPGARNLIYGCNTSVLPAHQGHNPTVERNTHKRSDEELAIQGNKLVNKNAFFPVTSKSVSATNTATLGSEDLYSALTDNLDGSLVQNDLLAQRGGRIHYLQNHTSGGHSEPLIVRPKQPNIPGNGSRSKSSKKDKGKGGVLRGRFTLPQFLKPKKKQSDPIQVTLPAYKDSDIGKSNLEPRHNLTNLEVATEVCLMNGAPVVRPTSLPLNGGLEAARPSNTLQGLQPRATIKTMQNTTEVNLVCETARSDEQMASDSSTTAGSELSHPSLDVNLRSRQRNESVTPPPQCEQNLDNANGNMLCDPVTDSMHNDVLVVGNVNSSDRSGDDFTQKSQSWYENGDGNTVADLSGFSGTTGDGASVRSGILLQNFKNDDYRVGERESAADYQC